MTLAMSPSLLSALSDEHLLAALHTEGPLTPAEIELANRLAVLVERESPESVETRLREEYEVVEEQSEFRAELLREILDLLDVSRTKTELISGIRRALENSHVEL